jgi:ribosomal-protein-alanine N-acetyltransferase
MVVSRHVMDVKRLLPIRTNRLLISTFNKEDWEAYHAIQTSRANQRYNFETYSPHSEKENRRYVDSLTEDPYDSQGSRYLFAIHNRADASLVGFIGLKNGELVAGGAIEVFFSIHETCWNQGYAAEALRGIIRFGFERIGLHRIFAGCDIDNVASKRVLEKAGMRFESRWRKDRLRNGKWTDGLGFAILEEDLAATSTD